MNTGKTYKTRQRECILECIRKKADAYITIQQLSEELEKQNRKVGLTTIYRTLDRLEAEKAIARALVNNPHIIMADEPTGNLDTKSTKDIMRLFEALHEEHKTIILVTHEPEIAACANRQLLLSDGMITKDAGKGVVMDVI